MREEAKGADPSDEDGDRRPPLWRDYRIPGRGKPQEESHRRLPAGAPWRDQQVHDRQGIADGPHNGAEIL